MKKHLNKIAQQTTSIISQLPNSHKALISSVSAVVLLLVLLPSDPATASRSSKPVNELELGKRYSLELEVPHQVNQSNAADNLRWQNYQVKSGDNLAKIFTKVGLTARDLYEVTEAGDDAAILRKIHPGDTLRFATNADGQLVQLAYAMNATNTLVISRTEQGYQTNVETKPIETRTEFAYATIRNSFWNAGIEAGLSDGQIMSVADMFGWDIDFALDMRAGDEFSVLFEKRYADGDFVGYGRILAAEVVNQGERYSAVLHDNGQYYTPQGRAMRKTFLRSPVNFTYISSSFNPRRLHPVTGLVRPHNGIDYAAPVGTPIMSSGDGKVIASNYNNLNGHYVFVQHGERYVTKYLHLSKRIAKAGDRVKQGQIIGRLGATGRVTGPHLHYEFLVDGVHRNPRTVQLPQAKSLDEAELPAFTAVAQQRLAALYDNRRVLLAMRQ